jgi:CDP-glucose 4,6-dehydratase
MFGNIYKGRKVLITGHTGFKGSWLTSWLVKLGAQVIGVSDKVPTAPAMFEVNNLEPHITHYFLDIRDYRQLRRVIETHQPQFVFHLAAQAIVSTSYESPLDTISTNVMGTATVLEVLKDVNPDCTAVLITSDKCYENVEWAWGYKETDHLGGKDIYSGSKGAAEVIVHSYCHSFFKRPNNKVKLATARAGNVIGGGDWAKDRIVVDCVRKWAEGAAVDIRSPDATRPWQHVLEPLSGYLTLGRALSQNDLLHGESFNFGPRAEQNHTVLDLLSDLSKTWHFASPHDAYRVTARLPFHEAGLLKLNCDKALFHLKWEANLHYKECVSFVSDWYYSYYRLHKPDMLAFTLEQISAYEQIAIERGMVWTH